MLLASYRMFQCLIIALICSSSLSGQQNLKSFLDTVNLQSSEKRMALFEMGLVSDHPGIFYHSLEKVIQADHFDALPVLKKLLARKDLSQTKRNLLTKAQLQLGFKKLRSKEKYGFVQGILKRPETKTTDPITIWALNQFAELTSNKDHEILKPLEKRSSLEGPLRVTKEKISFRLRFPRPIERYIAASKSLSPEIRHWAYGHLSHMDLPQAAQYLSHINNQRHLLAGRLEAHKIQSLCEAHRDRFPDLYR